MIWGIASGVRRAGVAVAVAAALAVGATACTGPGEWDDTGPEPGGSISYATSVADVSCAAADACVAVGAGSAARYNGRAWTETVVPGSAFFGFVTCGAPDLCLGNPSLTSDGQRVPLSRLDGDRWVPAADPTGTFAGAIVTDVTCVGDAFCFAAYERAGTAALARWDGTAWTPTPTPVPMVGASLRLDCASERSCLAMALVGQTATAYAWDGEAWAATAAPLVSATVVSCGAPGSCLASGYELTTGAIRLSVWDGTGWAFAPAPADRVQSLDCVSATWCLALTSQPSATAYALEGGEWRAVPLPAEVGSVMLSAVSCVSATRCLAGGSRSEGNAMHRAALWWDGTTWAGQPDLPRPTRPFGRFMSVSCPAEMWCMAVGTGMTGGTIGTNIQQRMGDRWKAVATPRGVMPDGELDVSCASPTFCVVVGVASAPGAGSDRLLQWDGRTLRPVDLRPLLGTARGPSEVSCTSSRFCLAAGGGVTLRWNGTAWASVANPEASVRDLDCLDPDTCRAVLHGVGPTGLAGLIGAWDGTSWTLSNLPVVDGAASFGEQISCITADQCLVTARATRAADPLLLAWNGQAWVPQQVAPGRDDPTAAAACTDVRRCVAVTATGGQQPSAAFITSDVAAGEWLPTVDLPRHEGMIPVVTSIDCRPTWCLAAGYETGAGERSYAVVLRLNGSGAVTDPSA